MKRDCGIALIAVMAALMVLSAIALGLAASVQTEARVDAADWDGLQAEQLARSGQEFAAFLEARGLRKTPDFMAGLPMEAVVPAFHYRAQLASGVVNIYFEADNGKLDLSYAPPEILTNLFTLWTGDFGKAQEISAAIEDWRDSDNDVRPNGAEAPFYSPLGYSPRNTALGVADAPLIRGLGPEDFQWKVQKPISGNILRNGLDAYITSAGTGSTINPNFAPDLVLRSIPGLNENQVDRILSGRLERFFEDQADLQTRAGISSNSPPLRYFAFGRNAPAILSVSSVKAGTVTRSERRVAYTFTVLDTFAGTLESKSAVGRIQRQSAP